MQAVHYWALPTNQIQQLLVERQPLQLMTGQTLLLLPLAALMNPL